MRETNESYLYIWREKQTHVQYRLWVWWVTLSLLWVTESCEAIDHPLAQTCVPQQRRLYVATVDGTLTAVDAEGHTLWQHSSEPLFSSTLSYGEPSESVPNLIPGLDKYLYHWDGNRLQRLPVTADDLIDRNFPHTRGSNLVGAKVREVVGVNMRTGQMLYRCSHLTCSKYDNHSMFSRLDTLKVSLHRVMVREADELTGEELWNFTVGELELSVAEGEGGGGEDGVGQEKVINPSCPSATAGWVVQVDSPQGVLNAIIRTVEGETVSLWQMKFPAPVVGVWQHNGGQLERLATNIPIASTIAQPALLLVNYNSQYYIEPVAGWESTEQVKLHRALGFSPHYKPFNPLQSFSVPVLHPLGSHALTLYNDEENFLQLCSSGPSGLAVYFCLEGLDSYGAAEENESGDQSTCQSTPTQQAPTREEGVMEKLWAAGLSVVKYTLFGLFVLGLNSLHQYHRRTGPVCSEQEEDVLREGPWLPPIPSTNSTVTVTATDEGDRNRKLESQSRFDKDYDFKDCLGRGGFGVVYHVKSRTDGGEYAVKRIKLPGMKSARQKVMREVHALAQLDHPKIVRYFHSWLEQAPPGWGDLEEWAPLSRRESYACAEQSPFPSVAGLLLAPSPSFNSLNHSTIHSELPPLLGSESRSSSFIIEFKEEPFREEGCFSHQLLSQRDDVSSDSSSSCNTEEHILERRDGFPVLPPEPPTYLFIQMQLCHKETLKDWLGKNVHNRTRCNVLHFFEQMLDAVLYVHDMGMMHRDLKPSNILFSLDGSVKVGDFGLVTGSISSELQSSTALKAIVEDHHTGNIGSHFYMSPEQTLGVRYDQKVDIFSLGVIFFELHYPFHTEMERAKVLEDLRKHRFPQQFCSSLPTEAQFVEWLMALQSSQRPSAQEVYSSARFKQLQRVSKHSDCHIIPKL